MKVKVLNIFYLTIFLKKNNIFQNKVKNNSCGGGTIIFEGKGRRTTKMNITFSMGNGAPNTVLKFFLQKFYFKIKNVDIFNTLN